MLGMANDKFELINSKSQYDEFFANTSMFNLQTQTYEPLNRQNGQDHKSIDAPDYRVSFSTQSKSYCIGCVDIVNSTKIASTLSQKNLAKYYEMFLNSLSKIITDFQGRVIKNIGDCLLFYFPESLDSNIEGMKKSMDCGIEMIKFQKEISDQLTSLRLPPLNYRVSIDYGSVIIMNTSNSPLVDLIGPSVNMCVKINHYAKKNEFVIGGDMKQVMKKFNQYQFQRIDSFDIGLRQVYPVYKISYQNIVDDKLVL